MAPPWSDTPLYSNMDTGAIPVNEYVNNVGFGFCSGIVGGSLYHFIKGFRNAKTTIPSKIVAGINATRANTLRTAGFCGVFNIVLNASYCAIFKLQGAKDDIDVWGDMLLGATTGAIMWAPRGLRSASRASLVFAAIPLAHAALTLAEGRYYLNRASESNSYSYPHYRHPQQQE